MSKYTDWSDVPLVLTLQQAAKVMGAHRNTIMNMIKDKRLAAVKVGREWRISKDEIMRYLGVDNE